MEVKVLCGGWRYQPLAKGKEGRPPMHCRYPEAICLPYYGDT